MEVDRFLHIYKTKTCRGIQKMDSYQILNDTKVKHPSPLYIYKQIPWRAVFTRPMMSLRKSHHLALSLHIRGAACGERLITTIMSEILHQRHGFCNKLVLQRQWSNNAVHVALRRVVVAELSILWCCQTTHLKALCGSSITGGQVTPCNQGAPCVSSSEKATLPATGYGRHIHGLGSYLLLDRRSSHTSMLYYGLRVATQPTHDWRSWFSAFFLINCCTWEKTLVTSALPYR